MSTTPPLPTFPEPDAAGPDAAGPDAVDPDDADPGGTDPTPVHYSGPAAAYSGPTAGGPAVPRGMTGMGGMADIGQPVENAWILIVDDEEANLLVLRRMLERAGYTNLQTISDSSRAIERFCGFEPDLLVLDLHMPQPDGFEVMAQLEPLVGSDSYVPILVLTADVTDATRERALAVGARDFLTKPFRYNELLLRINNLLETRALHTQLRREKAALEHRMNEQYAVEQARSERRRAITQRIEAVLERLDDAGSGDAVSGDGTDRRPAVDPSDARLTVVYQPIIELDSGALIGVEALSRFGTESQRSPLEWFVEAAEVGLGIQLELAALRKAVEGLPLLPDGVFLSVNASAETIRSAGLHRALAELPASRIVIELTEHERIEDYQALVEPVARLREMGVRLAVDDAGAGFASLQHILRLQPDIIKLDRTFIEGLAEDPIRRALTTALVSFATDIDAVLVAEGIATDAEREWVRAVGVRHGQGQVISEPTSLPVRLGSDLDDEAGGDEAGDGGAEATREGRPVRTGPAVFTGPRSPAQLAGLAGLAGLGGPDGRGGLGNSD